MRDRNWEWFVVFTQAIVTLILVGETDAKKILDGLVGIEHALLTVVVEVMG